MPFQIRRGTDAERSIEIFAVGEPIFTTDTRRLYVGDGTTQGGIRVSGDIPNNLDDLSDVNIPPSPASGDILYWDGASFTTKTLTPEIVEGSNYRINIIADDSTVMVDVSSSEIRGNLVGNVFGNVTGNLVGGASGTFSGSASGSFTGDVFANTIRVRDTIINDASTLLYDINTNTFYGSFNGDLDGSLKGSVFLDDSTPIVDGINGTITANGFVQFGSYTAGERPSGVNGMVIYNSTANRFQGFQNGGWINLDDGSGA